jgi:hypothetical protein
LKESCLRGAGPIPQGPPQREPVDRLHQLDQSAAQRLQSFIGGRFAAKEGAHAALDAIILLGHQAVLMPERILLRANKMQNAQKSNAIAHS